MQAIKQQLTICLLLLTSIAFAQSSDSTAIKNLLEKESATWRSGDVNGHAACWHIQPYSKVLVSLPDGTTIDVPPAMMITPRPGSMGNGGTSSNSNYLFSIYSDNAWVSHQEESISKEGNKTYSYEIRFLEKIKGEWKLVGQSLHIYKPK